MRATWQFWSYLLNLDVANIEVVTRNGSHFKVCGRNVTLSFGALRTHNRCNVIDCLGFATETQIPHSIGVDDNDNNPNWNFVGVINAAKPDEFTSSELTRRRLLFPTWQVPGLEIGSLGSGVKLELFATDPGSSGAALALAQMLHSNGCWVDALVAIPPHHWKPTEPAQRMADPIPNAEVLIRALQQFCWRVRAVSIDPELGLKNAEIACAILS